MNKQRTKFWGSVVLILLVSAYVMIKLGSGPGTSAPLVDSISPTDWIQGDAKSKVVLIEYSDFECPACAQYSKVVNDIAAEFGAHMAFVYRHYPLKTIHKNALVAAYAAEAAGAQGKFWEMHDKLFTYQKDWIESAALEEMFKKFAADLGLDAAKFDTDYNSRKIRNNVDLDIESGDKNDITYTPTFFLNGKKINNPRGYDEFRQLIRDAIQSNS